MRAPKGFGRDYFTFSAIQAYSVQTVLQTQVASIYTLLQQKVSKKDEELNENDPPTDILEVTTVANKSLSLCNKFYNLKTKLTLICHIFIPRCPYYTVCFAFRRSGIHPPLS